MAAHSHPQNRPSDTLHHWHRLRPNRCSAHLGEQQGLFFVYHNPETAFLTFGLYSGHGNDL